MPIVSSLFSICPRIARRKGKLIAESGLAARVFWLGAFSRRVVVDPDAGAVKVETRSWWFRRERKKYPFDLISAVSYGYYGAAHRGWWTSDGPEAFTIGLKLHYGAVSVPLFTFVGEGRFENHGPLPDWVYWEEYATDLAGVQDNESKRLADLMSKMIGVGVEPPGEA
jgi:hypothetical protein